MKCGGRGGVKFCWNLLPAACLVRSGVFSRGRKASFSGEFDMAFVRFPQTTPIVDVLFCSNNKVG